MASPALHQQLVSRVASTAGASASTRRRLALPAQMQIQTQTQVLGAHRTALLRAPAPSRNVNARRRTKARALAAPASEVSAGTQQVEFVLVRECHFGQAFFVVGSSAPLGNWDVTQALPLEWHEGHVWRASTILTEEEKAGLEFKFVMLGKRGEVEWQPTDNNKPGDSKGTDAPCTQREGLLILHRPWNGEALSSLPVYVPSTNGAATNGAATNGAVTNGAATNGAAATGNGSAKSQEKKGEKEEKAWGKNVLSQLLKSWGRKTLMDEEKGDK